MLGALGVYTRYARRLPAFLRHPLTRDDAVRRIGAQLERREQSFLALVEHAVLGSVDNPYRTLLGAAGIEHGDVAALVRSHGLEGALGRLHDAGVHVTLDEFKGRVPIERLGVTIEPRLTGFDNPLLTRHFQAATGGTRGVRRRVAVDLDLLEHEAAYQLLLRDAHDSLGRPFGIWRPIPPSASGINNCLRQVKLGEPVSVWFNPYRASRSAEELTFALFTRTTIAASRFTGARIASPRLCRPEEAWQVARWLAARKAEGRPAVLDTQAALGVRVCRAAGDEGLDIAGTLIGVGGEPFTEAKAAALTDAGAHAYCTYSMAETGRIALSCADGDANDDMHLLTDKLAVLQRPRPVGGGLDVPALHYTVLLPSAPKLMINVESDDYAVLTTRDCGCPFGALGLTTHVREVRSYEKLTAEGNHFLGSDIVEIVDAVLPARFGGGPTDYQFVEEEEAGLPRVSVVASPALGALDEAEVVSVVLDHLGARPRNRLMADVWRQGGTLQLVRREPYLSASGKILPLHLVRPSR